MLNFKRLVAMALAMGVGLSTTACNETVGTPASVDNGGNNSSGNNGDNSAPQIEDIDMDALNAELDELEKVLADLQNEISRIQLPVSSGPRAQGLDDSIDKGIRKLFDALLSGIDKVDAKVAELRAKVNEQLAKLDPMNPLHLVLLYKLQDYLKYMDQLEAQVKGAYQRVVDLIDDKVADIDRKIAGMDQSNPLTFIAWIYWNQMRMTIMEYRAQIAAKI